MIRFQFVEDHCDTHQVKRMCQVLRIQRSSFYKWRTGRQARQAKQAADAALLERIRVHHRDWNRTYGYRRITAELACDTQVGGPVNHKKVARLMRMHHIVGVHLRKPKTTTITDPCAQVFADRLGRDFTAEQPNTTYVGDI